MSRSKSLSSHHNYLNRMCSPDRYLCRMCSPDKYCCRILGRSLCRSRYSPDKCCCRYWSNPCILDSRPYRFPCSFGNRPCRCRSILDKNLGRFPYSLGNCRNRFLCSLGKSLGRSLGRFPYKCLCKSLCKYRNSWYKLNSSRLHTGPYRKLHSQCHC